MKPSRAAVLVLVTALVLALPLVPVAEASCDADPIGRSCREGVNNGSFNEPDFIKPCCVYLSGGYISCLCEIRLQISLSAPGQIFCPNIKC
ncbi:hypothetical protein TRIUR3_32796 [Triticum urartu]|uniref:Uncharacterized protein n=1 Tax=Triticum urartu TaxID=4572 RepID=M7ZN43_TRIUA|nr:hypothetical protein TRIUR3_32796 [Triticum urartu]